MTLKIKGPWAVLFGAFILFMMGTLLFSDRKTCIELTLEKIYPERIEARVVSKERNKLFHNSEYLSFASGKQFSVENYLSLWRTLEVGDSILKLEDSNTMTVFRKDSTFLVEIVCED